MDGKILLVIFAVTFVGCNGFGLREIWESLIGGAYGQYYPGSYPGYYPGPQGPGLYPGGPDYGNYGPPGPPGAHPGCPLCDSSVYSYCYQKQAHDACCCRGGGFQFNCLNTNCKFLYANSCQEHDMITNCCCVDLQKNAGAAAPPVVPPVIAPVVV